MSHFRSAFDLSFAMACMNCCVLFHGSNPNHLYNTFDHDLAITQYNRLNYLIIRAIGATSGTRNLIMLIYIHIYKFTSKCHSQTTPSYPQSGDSQGKETFLALFADKQTRNYDTECSNYRFSLSTLRSKGLSCSKVKWWAIYIDYEEVM